MGDFQFHKLLHRLGCRRKRHARVLTDLPETKQRALTKGMQDPQGVGSPPTYLLRATRVSIKQDHESPSRFHGPKGGFFDALEKKFHPRLPVPLGPN
ncbi:MAG: hypothetical protein RLZZ399_1972 [Verrucomicrobiota bacterium]